jgi:hypothetical protein
MMRRSKVVEVSELSVKVGKLITDERAKLLATLSTKDTKKLWLAVNKASGKTTGKHITEFGSPFGDLTALNKHFASIANDRNYDR